MKETTLAPQVSPLRAPLVLLSLFLAVGLCGLQDTCAAPAINGEGPSLSLGRPWKGSQIGAVSVCAWDGGLFHVYSCQRGLQWGTRPLVELLLNVGESLQQRYPRLKLVVGNLSRRNGGEIPYSVSHQAGRDADLGFVLFDRRGKQFFPLPLPRIREHGERHGTGFAAGKTLRFDVERNWYVARALVMDPRVQWVFVADFLKQEMLEWARDHGEDPSVLIRAEFLLHQPGTSSPHDDHFHVRLFCDELSRFSGCLDVAPGYSWSDAQSPRFEGHVQELVESFEAGGDADRVHALNRLGMYARGELAILAIRAWPDASPELSTAIREYLSRLELKPYAALMLDTALAAYARGRRLGVLEIASDLPTRLVDGFLARAAAIPTLPEDLRLELIRFARASSGPGPLKSLHDAWKPMPQDHARSFMNTASYVLNRWFGSMTSLEAFLDTNRGVDGTDVLLRSVPGICKHDRLQLQRLVSEIRHGGARRSVALRILERLFDLRFASSYGNHKMYQRWYTVIMNVKPRTRKTLPCDTVAIEGVLEGT